jgi:hypothetical protein
MILTGFVRIAGNAYPFARNAITGAAVFPTGDNLALAVLLAFLLAMIVVMVIALILRAFIGSPIPAAPVHYDVDELDKPRRKRSNPRNNASSREYPPIDDPYWDDK